MEIMELFNSLDCMVGTVTIDGKIVGIFTFLVNLIKIGVPVLLVIWGSWDLGKAVMAQKDDEIKAAQKIFIKKLVVALCVFLVPTFIGIALEVIGEDTNDVKNCFTEIF